jgi:coenzyme F420-reducing hydrogenase beta subunit
MLVELLKNGTIQGALISKFEIKDGTPVAGGYIATTPAEIMVSQGSIYMSFPLLSKQTMDAIRAFNGKLAVVALPCQCNTLRKIMDRDPVIREKTAFPIGLFCGHTSKKDLLLRVLQKKNVAIDNLQYYRFRRGLGRGMAVASMKDGSEKTWPTAFFNLYQNLFIESAPQCTSCFDHFAENADVSCGDIWTWEHRKDTIKHSVFCSRTAIGDEYVKKAIDDGALVVTPLTQEHLLKSNIRAAIYHKAISARSEIAAKHGITVKVPPQAKPSRWNERLAARIVFRFQTMQPEKALSMNRRYLKFWLYIFKGLTNF